RRPPGNGSFSGSCPFTRGCPISGSRAFSHMTGIGESLIRGLPAGDYQENEGGGQQKEHRDTEKHPPFHILLKEVNRKQVSNRRRTAGCHGIEAQSLAPFLFSPPVRNKTASRSPGHRLEIPVHSP